MIGVLNAPVGKETKESKETIATFKSFQTPANKLICRTSTIRRLYKQESKIVGYPEESSYDKKFKQECISKFGEESSKKLRLEERFVNAMKIFQKLVGLSQDLQVSESKINGGDETAFVRDFRTIEYQMREFIEDNMRQGSHEIVQDVKLRSEIPAYSVGGLFDEDQLEESKEQVHKKNYAKINQIEECLNHFQKYVIVPQVGDLQVEEKEC
eukprot:gene15975-17583_t